MRMNVIGQVLNSIGAIYNNWKWKMDCEMKLIVMNSGEMKIMIVLISEYWLYK